METKTSGEAASTNQRPAALGRPRLFEHLPALWTVFALLIVVAVSVNGQQASQAPDQSQAAASRSSQSDRDAYVIAKDHQSCERYYRPRCLDEDASSCDAYAKELSKDCPTPVDATSLEGDPVALRCAAKVKCWQNRGLSLALMNGACAADPDSANCEAAKREVSTAASCDSQ